MEHAVIVLETNIDNASGEILGMVAEKALNEKALDVYFSPIYMKKNRPAYKVTVLCLEEHLENITRLLFTELPTLGVRYWKCQRTVLERREVSIRTIFGKVRIKESYHDGSVSTVHPEYEDCRKISIEKGISLREVMEKVVEEYRKAKGKEK